LPEIRLKRRSLIAKSLSLIRQAIEKHQLLDPHSRFVIALSGGLDSMILAILLKEYNYHFSQNWDMRLLHIDHGFFESDLNRFKKFAAGLDCPLRIAKANIAASVARAKDKCWRCSWQRRKLLLENAEKNNIFSIALGHHQNDVVEALLLNMFFNSDISTLVPKQAVIHGRFYFIRPLYYFTREHLEKLAQTLNINAIAKPCPYRQISKRAMVRDLLHKIEPYNPHVISSIFNSLSNVKHLYLP
jgi:tRNA(Ile)-lysidine synthase TilS/MesJ